MPNDFVDLGYLNWSRVYQRDGVTLDDVVHHAYVADIRDRFRSALETENGGLNWEVSRIAKWAGGDDYGYGFKIRRLDSGTPSGHEWLILLAGQQGTFVNFLSEPEQSLQDPEHNNFFRYLEGSDNLDNYVGMHFHSLGGATTYDFDTTDSDAYDGTTPDFAAPNTSPRVDIAGFLPTPGAKDYPQGYIYSGLAEVSPTRWIMVWNHEKPFLGMYFGEAYDIRPSRYMIAGDLLVPRVSSDTFLDAFFALEVSYTNVSADASFWEVAGLTPDGAADTVYGVRTHDSLTRYNQPRADGTYDVDPIKVVNNNWDKGYLDKEIFPQVGWVGTSRFQLFDTVLGGSFKAEGNCGVPWKLGNPLPFAGWPLNPQDIGMGL